MTDLDTLLRDALERQAERAPEPEQVRARLDARLTSGRTATRRRTVLRPAALAVVAVAGIVAGVAVVGLPHFGTPPAAPDKTSVATEVDTLAIALRFSPTVLPAGWREVGRSLSDGRLRRIWRSGNADLGNAETGPRLQFVLVASGDKSLSGAGMRWERVTVAGVPGRFVGEGGKGAIEWEVAPGTYAVIATIGLTRAQVLAAAESVRAVPGTATFPLNTALRDEDRTTDVVVNGPDSWAMQDSVYGVTITVGTAPVMYRPVPDQLPTKQLTVEGHQARFLPVGTGHPYAELVVTLGCGRFLTVSVLNDGVPMGARVDPTIGLPAGPGTSSFRQLPADETTVVALATGVRWKEPSFG